VLRRRAWLSAKPQPMRPQSVSHGSTARVAAACSVLVGPMESVQKRQSGSLRQSPPILAWLISGGGFMDQSTRGAWPRGSSRGLCHFPPTVTAPKLWPRKLSRWSPLSQPSEGHMGSVKTRLFSLGAWQPRPGCRCPTQHSVLSQFPCIPITQNRPQPEPCGSCDQT